MRRSGKLGRVLPRGRITLPPLMPNVSRPLARAVQYFTKGRKGLRFAVGNLYSAASQEVQERPNMALKADWPETAQFIV